MGCSSLYHEYEITVFFINSVNVGERLALHSAADLLTLLFTCFPVFLQEADRYVLPVSNEIRYCRVCVKLLYTSSIGIPLLPRMKDGFPTFINSTIGCINSFFYTTIAL
jgi:hypothetical protein